MKVYICLKKRASIPLAPCMYFVPVVQWYGPLIVCVWQAITAWLAGADVQPDLGAGHLIISSLQLRCMPPSTSCLPAGLQLLMYLLCIWRGTK